MKLKIVIIVLVAVMLISGCFLAWSLGSHNPSAYTTDSNNPVAQFEWFTHSVNHSGNVQHQQRTVIEK
ncbi:hypothetical protein [uncultured Pseudoramibacter sp.]|jgi:flagellar basal body-associated protein FliL|uniref:hypothetical protein n=1 Tax=uncultured Pseudoramibacter sp. TaxID=1623493 RepID=UPI0025ED69DC|nr:hypothetical protein [uncultured Pseudoramibacter sp.]